MSFRFGKLIIITCFLSTGVYACVCEPTIKSATKHIKEYINNENLDIANKYLKAFDGNLSIVSQNEIYLNQQIKQITNVEYNVKKENGILLKLKHYNNILNKIDALNTLNK